MFFKLVFQVYSDIYPELESLGHKAVPFLILGGNFTLFPQWLHQSAFPPTVHEVPFSPQPRPHLVVCGFIDDSHSDRCELRPHCRFFFKFIN